MTQIVSSISSLEIYAPSAGSSTYAKCDSNGRDLGKMVTSADVSAYQVVSATGSQLYAGTAHLTSVNQAPISAARAGNAANAGMANSAYYDGAGRLISALPDSATVSAIASSYASSKADASSLSSYALSADVSGVIDTVSSNSASWGQGGVDSATVSSIASSYAESAVSSKLDTSAQVVTATAGDGTYVTSINGMGLSGQGGGATGDTYWSATNDSAFIGGFGSNLYGSGSAVSIGWDTTAKNTAVAIGVYGNSAYNSAVAIGAKNSADYGGIAIGAGNQTRTDGVSIGKANTAYGANNRIIGTDNSAKYNSEVFGTSNRADDGITIGGHNSAYGGIAIGSRLKMSGHNGLAVGQFNARSSDTLFVIGDGTLDGRSDALYVDLSGGMSAKGNISANGVELGAGVDSATVSAIASSYAESAVSSKADSSALSSYALSADVSGVVSAVTANSATWGQSGPVTATASAAAKVFTSTGSTVSSFTGVSSVNGSALLVSHMLPNAQQANGDARFVYMPATTPWGSTEYTGVLSPLQYATGAALAMKQQGNYGAYYKGNEWFISDVGTNTAANGVVRAELHRTRGIHLYGSSLNSATGFHLNGSGVDGKSGESAWQYGPTEYNMLIDVNNTVNTQSANWGGSALALSAGPGVKLELSGSTLVASTDETVLWSSTDGSGTTATACTLSEAWTNFEHIDIWYKSTDGRIERASLNADAPVNTFMLLSQNYNGTNWWVRPTRYSISGTEISANAGAQYTFTDDALTRSNTAINNRLYKVIGVNRTAGG